MIGNTVRGFIFDGGYTFGAHCMQHSHSFQSDKTTYRRGVLLVHFVTYRGVTYCFVTYYYVLYSYAFIYPMIHRYSLQTHYFFPMFSSICPYFTILLSIFPLSCTSFSFPLTPILS
jgi:hypothetical protein